MIRVDYHLHTSASHDGHAGPREVVERALAAALGMVCITDHDTIDGAAAVAAVAPAELQVITGCEFTCADGSHVIGMGLTAPIAERRLPALLDAIHEQDGLVLLPHPYRRGSGVFRAELRRTPAFLRDVLTRADLLEAYNGRDTAENNARSHALALASGLGAVAGSDAHRPEEIGRTFVEYAAEGPLGEGGPELVHGTSPRRIFGAPRPAAPESALKRRLMELYHARAGRHPALDRAYRALRARLHADGPPRTGAPRFLHAFPPPHAPEAAPGAPQPLAGGEAGPGRGRRDHAPGAPLAGPAGGGAGGPPGLPR